MKPRRMAFCLALINLCAASALADTYTWTGKAPSPGNVLWSNPQNWSPSSGVPGAGDTAIIGTSTSGFDVTVDTSVTVANLTLVNDIVTVSGTLTVSGTFESQYNTLTGNGSVVVNGSMSMDIITYVDNGTTVVCPLTINGSATVNSNAVMYIGTGVNVVNNGSFTLANTAAIDAALSFDAAFINQGTFSGGNAVVSMGNCLFSNAPAGTVTARSGCKSQFAGELADSGTFAPAANGTNYVSADTALHAGAQFTGAGLTELAGTTTLDG